MLSLALVGFIWQLIYSRTRASSTPSPVAPSTGTATSKYNLWAALLATSWRHTGYVMLLYLAGLKGVDPTLREAAKVDGATERQTFFRVVFPVMAPINIIVLVITVHRVAARLRPRLGHQQGPQRAGAHRRPW